MKRFATMQRFCTNEKFGRQDVVATDLTSFIQILIIFGDKILGFFAPFINLISANVGTLRSWNRSKPSSWLAWDDVNLGTLRRRPRGHEASNNGCSSCSDDLQRLVHPWPSVCRNTFLRVAHSVCTNHGHRLRRAFTPSAKPPSLFFSICSFEVSCASTLARRLLVSSSTLCLSSLLTSTTLSKGANIASKELSCPTLSSWTHEAQRRSRKGTWACFSSRTS